MKILAIETSCDETALAILEAEGGLRPSRRGLAEVDAPRFKILENLVSSQIAIHRPYGGVVPNLAKREHLKNLPILYRKIFANSKFARPRQASGEAGEIRNSKLIPDLIAVTVGPGLEPALWTGVEFAKETYKRLKTKNEKLKLIGVNHLKGHLYSFLLSQKTANSKSKILNPKQIQNSKFKIQNSLGFRNSNLVFPAVSLLVSGGHTILLKMDSLTKIKKLGETRDDAVGEAFDKVARLLELPYPGGPEIERVAREGNPQAIPFPRPMLHAKNYDFSFSGLKTAVLYHLREQNALTNADFTQTTAEKNPRESASSPRWSAIIADVAASFQQAAIDVLVAKTARAANEFGAKSIMLSGGVAANQALREALQVLSFKLHAHFFAPPVSLNTDNAAIIGAAGYIACLQKEKLPLKANGNLNF